MNAFSFELYDTRTILSLLKSFNLKDGLSFSLKSTGTLYMSVECKEGARLCISHSITNSMNASFCVDVLTFLNALEMLLAAYGGHTALAIKFYLDKDELELIPQSIGSEIRILIRLIQSIPETKRLAPSLTSISLPSKTLSRVLPDHNLADCDYACCNFEENKIEFKLSSVSGSFSTSLTSECKLHMGSISSRIPVSVYKSIKLLLKRCDKCCLRINATSIEFDFEKQINLKDLNIKISIG